ncbi:HNH endonuclease [Jannaschia sp. LMIT008]|uniref:HNH endonuclease n=1 Tax=Jannaschia maritima TaxID=3032585 RepID=UPI00281178F8|nr:HNH endonuclease [Jannaschia sp. LMIT008]
MGRIENEALTGWGNAKVNRAQQELDDLNAQIAEVGTDIALTACSSVPGVGIACDFASLGISVSRGDWLGAALDLVGFVPVIGDGIKGGVRGGRILQTSNDLRRAVGVAQDAVNASRRVVDQGLGSLRTAARQAGMLSPIRCQSARRYWAANRRDKLAKLRRELRECDTEACRQRARDAIQDHFRNPWGTRLPEAGPGKGAWGGQPGNSRFVPEAGTPMANAIARYNRANGTNHSGVRFREGFPDFGQYRSTSVEIPNMRGNYDDGRRSTPDDLGDFGQARQAMADRNGGRWTRSMENGQTWHHHQDGVTMELIDQDVHAAVGHTGGGSMMRDTETF